MDLIRAPLSDSTRGDQEILLPVERQTLAKLRWHHTAEDGREFGFNLAKPLHDGASFFQADGATYRIAQQPEVVVEIPLATPRDSARLGWLIGNLHFPIELAGDFIYAADDPALRQMLDREEIPFAEASRVFHPARHGHVH